MQTRILLVDDHKIFREGLHSLLEDNPELSVVGGADDGRDAIELARDLKPDVILMDITMPGLNGIEATRQILSENEDIKIIALSMHAQRRFIGEVLNAGASGYLLKDCASEELVRAIQSVKGGGTYLSPAVTGEVVESFVRRTPKENASAFETLSEREREVLQLLAEGRSIKEIGDHLHLSIKTIHTHRQHIMDKLSIYSVAGLTKYAVREGLTTL